MELSRNRVVLFDQVVPELFFMRYKVKKIGIYFPEYEKGITIEAVDHDNCKALPTDFIADCGGTKTICQINVRDDLKVLVLGTVEETVDHINKSLRGK